MRQDDQDNRLETGEPTPQELEFEIERTRERMSTNIDALGDKLHPDNLKQQAKEAIAEKAQDVVANVGDQARETGSRVIDFITQYPLPVAAVGLGAIWLFSLRKGNRSEVSGDRMARFAYTGPERREPNGRPSLGRRLHDRADSVRHSVGSAASHTGERVGELRDRVSERAGELGGTARAKAREARGGLEHMVRDNPLAIAAGAVIIGLALGMLLPETEPERRVMGDAREELGDRVSAVAGRVKDAALDAGREVTDTVREEFEARAPEVTESLKEAAANVKDQVKTSAERVADEAKQEARRGTSNKLG
jgi:ElaB/YqjD/DUF883 family membrane-anchored ribosome-binding protein/gas vesicle protein